MILQNLYQTKIECLKDSDNSNYYNVNIDSTNVRVVVSLIDFNGNPVTNKNVTLTVDQGTFTSVKTGYTGTIASGSQSVTGTTNSSGQFAVLYSATVWGLCTFSANNSSIQINVKGFRLIASYASNKINLYANEDFYEVRMNGNFSVSANTNATLATVAASPSQNIVILGHHNRSTLSVVLSTGGAVIAQNNSSQALTNQSMFGVFRFAK